MREIKFRAWDKQDLCFYYSDDGKRFYGLSSFFKLASALQNYPDNLMQYTGLKDKNGVEIYEGDIIQWWNKVSKPQVVKDTAGGWNPFIDDCATDHSYHYEVIGNIYEDYALLQ